MASYIDPETKNILRTVHFESRPIDVTPQIIRLLKHAISIDNDEQVPPHDCDDSCTCAIPQPTVIAKEIMPCIVYSATIHGNTFSFSIGSELFGTEEQNKCFKEGMVNLAVKFIGKIAASNEEKQQ